MRTLTSPYFSRLENIQAQSMTDEGVLTRYHESLDEYGAPVRGITGSSTISCGFRFVNGEVREGGRITQVEYDGVLRLHRDQEISVSDMFTLTKKAGLTLDLSFYVYEQPKISASAKTVKVKKVTVNEQ